jgi:hypothetical protein
MSKSILRRAITVSATVLVAGVFAAVILILHLSSNAGSTPGAGATTASSTSTAGSTNCPPPQATTTPAAQPSPGQYMDTVPNDAFSNGQVTVSSSSKATPTTSAQAAAVATQHFPCTKVFETKHLGLQGPIHGLPCDCWVVSLGTPQADVANGPVPPPGQSALPFPARSRLLMVFVDAQTGAFVAGIEN